MRRATLRAVGSTLPIPKGSCGLPWSDMRRFTSSVAEREAALAMLGRRGKRRRITLGADKAYDVADFVDRMRERAVTPHIAVDGRLSRFGKRRATRINRRTTRHPGYAASQRLRKRIEEGFS